MVSTLAMQISNLYELYLKNAYNKSEERISLNKQKKNEFKIQTCDFSGVTIFPQYNCVTTLNNTLVNSFLRIRQVAAVSFGYPFPTQVLLFIDVCFSGF